MKGERNTDCDFLMGAYGIGRRLATRVAALLSKRIDATPTLLAAAADEPAVARLLLSPALLGDLEQVAQPWLQEQGRRCGVAEWELLRLVGPDQDGWRTLALEDDLLVEQAAGEPLGPDDVQDLSLVRAAPREMSVQESRELFAPEEVARLKLTVLTSQNPDERVECLRKLVFAPMDGAQKAGVFLSVLTDREAEPRVRREAVRSLEQIGFRTDLADAVRGLFHNDSQEAVYALRRLAALLGEAQQAEAALVLAVVLEVFDQQRDAEVLRELLRLIARAAGILVGNYQKTRQFFETALRHLARDFDGLCSEIEDALAACAEQAPELGAELLWRELDRNENARVRSLLLSVYESLESDPDRAADLARRAVSELLNPLLPESEKTRLRYGLVRIGEPAVLVALGRLGQAAGVERAELIRLVDVLCTESDVSDPTIQKAVAALIDLLKLGDASTRRSVVQAAVLGHPRVEAALQESLARELLELSSELRMPGILDSIQATLERIGPPALGPAVAMVARDYPCEAANRAARAIARIVQDAPDRVDGAVAGRILEQCLRLLDSPDLGEGAFTGALAAVCGYTAEGARHFDDCLRRLKDPLWSLPYAMDALDALGIMAGSANASERHQRELFELFDAIVTHQARARMGVRKETPEGPVYEFGREINFDIRVVPAAVKGLERLCVGGGSPAELRTAVVRRLLVLWEGVSKVRVVWGPAAIEALIGAMCSVACSPTAAVLMKVLLGASLLRSLNKLSVVRSIGRIGAQIDATPQLHRFILEAGERLLEEWEACEVQDEERRLELLRSAALLAANPSLDGSSADVLDLREYTLQGLYRGLREGMNELRESLLRMRDCPDLPEEQRREIDERLGKAFGLIRAGSGG
ncbi:MAG: hypothetical protein GXY85_12935 [Candidatus Brocadiaceae bacterium]|nr:hypothetical protein [Candidatus Brocadiaceae bacterium]